MDVSSWNGRECWLIWPGSSFHPVQASQVPGFFLILVALLDGHTDGFLLNLLLA